MKTIISKLISKIKKEPYQIDSAISLSQLFEVVLKRGLMLACGLLRKPFFKKAGKAVFIGRNVTINAIHNIRCGRITIHDSCHINAMCKGGGVDIGDNFMLGGTLPNVTGAG